MLWLSCSISKPHLWRGGHLSVPPDNCCHLECYVPVPILVSDGASLSPGGQPGFICLTTSVLGAGTLKGDHPWDADLHMVPGWAAGPRRARLVLEGGVRHKSAPAQGIAALRVVCEENGVQGPMNDL